MPCGENNGGLDGVWVCDKCTLENELSVSACIICENKKPSTRGAPHGNFNQFHTRDQQFRPGEARGDKGAVKQALDRLDRDRDHDRDRDGDRDGDDGRGGGGGGGQQAGSNFDHQLGDRLSMLEREVQRMQGGGGGARSKQILCRRKAGIPPFVATLSNMLNKGGDVGGMDGLGGEGGEGVEDVSDVISWSPDGKRIMVHQLDRFSTTVLPRYFKPSKTPSIQYASFLKQLNTHNFRTIGGAGRWQGEPNQREYEHPLFQKGQPHLLHDITRKTNTAESGKKTFAQLLKEKSETNAHGESGPSGGSYSSGSPQGSHVKESHTRPQSIPPPNPLGRERTNEDPHSDRRGGGGGGYGGGAGGGEGYGYGGGGFDDRRKVYEE